MRRVLVVEDTEDDFLLMQREFAAAGYEPAALERVDTPEALRRALVSDDWSVVLSDYTMPRFNALDALGVVRELRPEVPFIIVSGSIGEESAVAALKAGAATYVMKERLPQLVRVVEREVREAQVRRERSEAFENLQRALKARDEFLSMAAHELKTPLASLLLQAESLVRNAGARAKTRWSSEQISERVGAMVGSGRRLSQLIDRMLDISQVTSGNLELWLQHVDLVRIVEDAIARLAEVLRDAKCTVRLEAPESAPGLWDRERIETVITNLLTNAAKYGSGKPIVVTIEDGPAARLRVIDRGIGIPEADQQRIFERFERAVPDQSYSGFGLGLWLTRKIVEAHGGSVEVASRAGEGATFTVVLPKEPAGE